MTLTALIPAEKVWLTRIAGSGIAEPTGLYTQRETVPTCGIRELPRSLQRSSWLRHRTGIADIGLLRSGVTEACNDVFNDLPTPTRPCRGR